MISTIISFMDTTAGTMAEKKEQVLAKGGYESSFLSNLVYSYLFFKLKDHFHKKNHGLYRNDDLTVLKNKKRV